MPAHVSAASSALAKVETRIAFLCGCVEPGKDGVGDYTRLLAGECARRGVATLCIALNDPHADAAAGGEGILQLDAAMNWQERVAAAREAVERFSADIVSLHWVPYSFHPRGIPRGIERDLARIIAGRAAHMMCHEVWIGAEARAKISHRIIGAAQRGVLKRVTQSLKPVRVHTSNATYAGLLERAGIMAEVLPMFGSIPIAEPYDGGAPGVARFAMFGALHPAWPPLPLLERLRGLAARIEIGHIGRMGSGESVWAAMERRYGGEIFFARHGEQPPDEVARLFSQFDYGIAATPLAIIGKSASAAAMLEHGLPVIVNRDDIRYPGIDPGSPPEGVIPMDGGMIDALRAASHTAPRPRLAAVADQFLESLQVARR